MILTSTRTEFEAGGLAARLEAEGIRVRVFGAAANVTQWEGGMSNLVRVMVRRGDLEAARVVLREARREARAIDWASVDVGEPEEGFVPAPAPGPRVGGYSEGMFRLRRVGVTLMLAPFVLNATLAMRKAPWVGLAVVGVAVLLAWLAPLRPGGVSGGPGREGRGSP